jgi:hypothetical protein
MKKTFNLILTAVFIFFLMSCSSAIERDAKKAADLACKAQEMSQQVMSGEISMEESMELAEEATQLMQEMQVKYDSGEDYEAFMEAYNKALANCN